LTKNHLIANNQQPTAYLRTNQQS